MPQSRGRLDVDDAINFILLFLSDPKVKAHAAGYGETGYDVFLPYVMRAFLVHSGAVDHGPK